LDTVNELEDRDVEHERWQRIEKWRMEQSIALLQEIEKETRRRRNSRASVASDRIGSQHSNVDAMEGVSQTKAATNVVAPPPLETAPAQVDTADGDESFWRRITRRVIRDLMGIDESLLSVLFGDSIPAEAQQEQDQDQKKSTPAPETKTSLNTDHMMMNISSAPQGDDCWEERLLERIARELGILVHQICEHPGAFSTYLRTSTSTSNDYAGIPVTHSTAPASSSRLQPLSRTAPHDSSSNLASTYSPYFSPTLQGRATSTHAALWGIEEENYQHLTSTTVGGQSLPRTKTAAGAATVAAAEDAFAESARLARECDYWERELDVKMVFRYLRNRFGSNYTNTGAKTSSPGRRPATQQQLQQDASHRAAIIRQHHPLVARAHARSQTQFQHQLQPRTHSNSGAGSSPVAGASPSLLHRHFTPHPSSSCASQSTKLSAASTKRIGGSRESGSSRNYWDLGGSVGSGSAVVAGVGMGV
jgi:hypothetical protein